MRGSKGSIRRSRDPVFGKGLGHDVRAELAPGRLGNNVLGQLLRIGQGKVWRFAESVDTAGFPSRAIRHEEGRHERETS